MMSTGPMLRSDVCGTNIGVNVMFVPYVNMKIIQAAILECMSHILRLA